jgi:hypothetical protein
VAQQIANDIHSRIPNIQVGADKDDWEAALECHGVNGPVQMDGEKERVRADQLKALRRVNNAMPERRNEGFVRLGEDGLLENTFDFPIQFCF